MPEGLVEALERGPLDVVGRLWDASNLALLCEVPVGDATRRCIYKPQAGERPLWDFPGAVLGRREVLTAAAADCFGWDLVPPTVWRTDGPAGPGMCQEWVGPTGPDPVGLFPPDELPPGWLAVARGRAADGTRVVLAHADDRDLRRMAVLDALVNNADRKGGHLLRGMDGRLAGIDHGITFHAEPKLRTVLWGWAGTPLDPWLRAELRAGAEVFASLIAGASSELSAPERRAARTRLDRLLGEGLFPLPGGDWPALPWPPL